MSATGRVVLPPAVLPADAFAPEPPLDRSAARAVAASFALVGSAPDRPRPDSLVVTRRFAGRGVFRRLRRERFRAALPRVRVRASRPAVRRRVLRRLRARAREPDRDPPPLTPPQSRRGRRWL